MGWREAFLAQARSDHAIFFRLNDANVEYCHRLHYLQMACEKLAKGFLTPLSSATPPEPTHAVLVRMLQVLKTRPDVRRRLGFQDAARFRNYINSLLEVADKIEKLAPDLAGFSQPNPE